MDHIELGPFELIEPLGEGGMGEIWRAVHARTRIPVAVKLLRNDRLAAYHDELEREVRAHASLNHPGVVVLFDFGTVPRAAARAAMGQLTAGSPYVAMELAQAGSLRSQIPLGSWSEVRHVVVDILQALSHAHARGVVHRDIKPENILLFGEHPHVAKLADFGIAHAQSREHEAAPAELETFAGTPHYVAPEQALGRWRMFGPWTDIYAVGCVVWELVCGSPPYDGQWLDIVQKHIEGERVEFRPQIPVPDDLEGWLRFAMAHAPLQRFRTCADALAALPGDQEGGEKPRGFVAPSPWVEHAPTYPDPAIETPTEIMRTVVESSPAFERDEGTDHAAGTSRAPVFRGVPNDWRSAGKMDDLSRLHGTGLGLFELREPSFIGREAERDILWQALQKVGEGGHRAVFIVGGPGVGKSALARWLATRAEEVGAARQLIALNTPGAPGPAHGFAGLLRRTLHAWNLSGDDLREHIVPRITLGDHEARLLTGWLGAAENGYPYPNSATRDDLAHRLLVAFTQTRPVVAWLDDLQWSEDLTETLEYVLSTSPEPNLLAVATVRSDILAESPQIARRLAPLFDHPASIRIDLEPLPPVEEQALVREFLPVDDDTAQRVAERAEGNPLFARQLLRWLVDTSSQEPTESGRQIDLDSALPETIQDLFDRRIDDLIASFDSDALEVTRAVESAAVLGRQVDREEWKTVHGAADGLTDQIAKALVMRGLAHETPTGIEFDHAFLVDSLVDRAARGGRLEQHHQCCAQALAHASGESLDTRVREMNHWARAAAWEQAIEVSEAVTNPLARRGQMDSVRDIVRRRLAWLHNAGYPESSPRRLQALLKLGILTATGADSGPHEARKIAVEVLERAREENHAELEMNALELLAMIAERQGRFDESLENARQALLAAERLPQPRAAYIARVRLGWANTHTGNIAAATEAFDAVLSFADVEAEAYLRCYALVGKIWLELVRRRFGVAEALIAQLLDAARENGWAILQTYGNCHGTSLHVMRGNFEAALEVAVGNREALADLDSSSEDVLVHSLEGLAYCALGRFDEAHSSLVTLRGLFMDRGVPSESGLVAVVELAVASGRQDRDAFDAAAQWLDSERGELATVRPEHPTTLDMAAERWAETDPGREAVARRLAGKMRQRTGAVPCLASP